VISDCTIPYKAFYLPLIAKATGEKVAIVACLGKLIVFLEVTS
jgi:hypothetical protein